MCLDGVGGCTLVREQGNVVFLKVAMANEEVRHVAYVVDAAVEFVARICVDSYQ